MPDSFIFSGWPERYQGCGALRLAKQRDDLLAIERHFPNTTLSERARKMGMTLGNYWRLRKKFGLPINFKGEKK